MDMKKDITNDLKRLSNLVMRFFRNNKIKEARGNTTHQQAAILGFIHYNNCSGKKVYQKDIERQFSIRRSTATECMKRLEKQGMIIREVSKTDARLKEIILTEKTIAGIENACKQKEAIANIIGEGITEEEILVMQSIIRKMEANLEKQELLYEKNTKKSKN